MLCVIFPVLIGCLVVSLQFSSVTTRLYNQLYQRNTRRAIRSPVVGPELWHFPPVDAPELDADADEMDGSEEPASIGTIFSRSNKTFLVLTEIPQVGRSGKNSRGGNGSSICW